jgi:hypothetical protein
MKLMSNKYFDNKIIKVIMIYKIMNSNHNKIIKSIMI